MNYLNKIKYSKILVFCYLFCSATLCIPINDKVPLWNAQIQINAAVDFKVNDCYRQCVTAAGTNQNQINACQKISPSPPLFVFTDQEQRNLDLCSIAITRTNCPLNGFPIICLGIYLKKPLEQIPWQFNFNENAKQKFRF